MVNQPIGNHADFVFSTKTDIPHTGKPLTTLLKSVYNRLIIGPRGLGW